MLPQVQDFDMEADTQGVGEAEVKLASARGGDKWVKSTTVRWPPQGCLVGKYKPFGKNSSLKINLELSAFTNMFLHKKSNNKKSSICM